MTDDDSRTAVTRRGALSVAGAAIGGLALGGPTVLAQSNGNGNGQSAREYRVTVANLTTGQPFTPPAAAAHKSDVEIFAVGDEASMETKEVAENGNLGPLTQLIEETNAIRGSAVADTGPLVPKSDPGETGQPYHAELHLSADGSAKYLSLLGMLVATNDGIVGLDTVPLPREENASLTYYANGYDVGTEQNTERFGDLVPPAKTLILGGEPEGTGESDEEIAEDGVIRPHPGISGDGDLPPEVYDWDEPAALVQVERTG